MLVYPKIDELALFIDASDHSVGATLQQRGDNGWEPLAFFSKKLNAIEAKYSAFDRELAMYLTVKQF